MEAHRIAVGCEGTGVYTTGFSVLEEVSERHAASLLNSNFWEDDEDKGLFISWCPQLRLGRSHLQPSVR